jgi:uncharacterized protein
MSLFSPLLLKNISKKQVQLFVRNGCFIFLLIGLFSGIGLGSVYFICYMNGIEFASLTNLTADSTTTTRNCARLLALVSHASFFMLPALAFTYLEFGKNWSDVFKFKNSIQIKSILLSILLLLISSPSAQWLYKINYSLNLPDIWAKTDLKTTEKVVQLMVMHAPMELLLNLLAIAVVPAIGEEMIFRGLVQQCLARATKSHWWAIGLSAAIFSAAHGQFLGFLPRMLLGVLLGYIFYCTKNLWHSIVAHGVFNGMQVIILYILPEHVHQLNPSKISVLLPAAIGSVILMVLIGALLQRACKINESIHPNKKSSKPPEAGVNSE